MPKTRLKPKKPRRSFPLTAHANGQWCKKIRGKVHFFGVWADPKAAIDKYLKVKDDLQAGRVPRLSDDALGVADLCNRYLTPKLARLNTGELSPRTFQEQEKTCERLVGFFGRNAAVDRLQPVDFEKLRADISKTRGPVALSNEVIRVRSVFKYAFQAGLIDRPIKFGPNFTKANQRAIREVANRRPPRFFEPEEIRRILAHAEPQIKAFIFLGLNCAFGAADIATLPRQAIDLKRGWIRHARAKTAVDRRIPLWSETVDALAAAQKVRTTPASDAESDLAFLTRFGRAWVRPNRKGTPNDEIGKAFARLLRTLKLKRHGVSFYALRHCFQTIAEETGDLIAVAAVMGHTDQSMAAHYRERITDERLRNVVDHVRQWLVPFASALPHPSESAPSRLS